MISAEVIALLDSIDIRTIGPALRTGRLDKLRRLDGLRLTQEQAEAFASITVAEHDDYVSRLRAFLDVIEMP